MTGSKYLNSRQVKGLIKVGDLIVPGDDQIPSFSQSGCAGELDRMFEYMNEADREGLKAVLGAFSFLPRWALRVILLLATSHRIFPGPLGAGLRMLTIGVKGAVATLYYSDLSPDGRIYKAIEWDAAITERQGDAEPETGKQDRAGISESEAPPGAERPRAVEAFERARSGLTSLNRLPLAERSQYLVELSSVILRRQNEVLDRIQADTRKSRADALISEVFGVLDNLAWLNKHGGRLLREHKVHTPIALMGKKSRIWFEPLGAVLIISPWNYPFYQALVPIASAFLAGNTVVYKPSEWTPLEGLIEDLLTQAQFAPNWVQVVYGDGQVGAELIDQKPAKIFFTGSSRTGRKILTQAARHLIPVELELGGKDPMIVFEDVNLERAAAGAAWGAFTNTGQSCTSVERLYVQDSIYDAFKQKLLEEVSGINQAVDRDGNAEIGAMTTDFQVEIVRRQVEDAKAKGAVFLTGEGWDGHSDMIPPMVVEKVTEEMLLAREETFGPILPLYSFKSEEEAIALANCSEYGLSASVWSRDLDRARRVARSIATGNVSINNVMLTEGNPALPFGGVKQSGYGRYKGEHGLHAFCNVKSVIIDKDSGKIEANWYPYTSEKYRIFSEMTAHLFSKGIGSFIRFLATGLKLERYAKQVRKSAKLQEK